MPQIEFFSNVLLLGAQFNDRNGSNLLRVHRNVSHSYRRTCFLKCASGVIISLITQAIGLWQAHGMDGEIEFPFSSTRLDW